MRDLVLHVKKEYFDQAKSGAKLEEYRLVNPYWSRRLVGKNYDRVILLCGYPSRNDESRRIIMPWGGWRYKWITHPHFGDSKVEVYAIALIAPNKGLQADACPTCRGKGEVNVVGTIYPCSDCVGTGKRR